MAEFLQSLGSSWQLQREGGGGGFYLTMALPMGSRLWSGCLTFPTLLAPPPLPLAACLPSAWAPGATLIPHRLFSTGPTIYSWTVSYHHMARAPCLSSESPSLCAKQKLQGRG